MRKLVSEAVLPVPVPPPVPVPVPGRILENLTVNVVADMPEITTFRSSVRWGEPV